MFVYKPNLLKARALNATVTKVQKQIIITLVGDKVKPNSRYLN